MDTSEDYCELCELPRSQCPHGQPRPEVTKAAAPAPKPRKRAPAKPRTPSAAAAAASSTTLRWTPPEALKPLIVSALERAGGELEADELFRELEALAEDRLRPADRETTPEGELRWRYAARRARVSLIREGLMTKTTPGIWQLSRPAQP